MRKLLVILLLFINLPVSAQQERRVHPRERMKPPDYSEFERLREKWLEDEEQEAREERTPTLDPPAIVPDGWISDYEYDKRLLAYLSGKYEAASKSNKDLYVYAYADWDESCLAFRKSAGRKEYQELLASNDIIMVDYAFLNRMHGARFSKLPVFLKVHQDGTMGPEHVRPISSPNDHPRKAFYTLKKFLESNQGAGGSS